MSSQFLKLLLIKSLKIFLVFLGKYRLEDNVILFNKDILGYVV
jgi:hypothetical protein